MKMTAGMRMKREMPQAMPEMMALTREIFRTAWIRSERMKREANPTRPVWKARTVKATRPTISQTWMIPTARMISTKIMGMKMKRMRTRMMFRRFPIPPSTPTVIIRQRK